MEAVLGEPQAFTAPRSLDLYSDGYPDTIEFSFRDEIVTGVEWTYWAQ